MFKESGKNRNTMALDYRNIYNDNKVRSKKCIIFGAGHGNTISAFFTAQNENERNQFSVYQKRKGTVDQGKEYECLMCAYYALKLCFDENVVDFEITTNNQDYGDFDDVALKVTFRDNSSHLFLMQMKHTEQDRGITDTMLSAKKGDFSLLKYFESFQKLQDRDNITCIVFTNRKSQLNDKSEFKLEDENIVAQSQPHKHLLIDTVSDDQRAHIFNFKQIKQNSQNFEKFFKSFYLFTNQKGASNMQSHIEQLLYERFGCIVDFISFMRQWCKGKFVLYKHDVIVKLTELVLSSFIQEIPRNVNAPQSEKAKLLKDAIMHFEMTLVKDCDSNAVAKIWMQESADSEMMSKASLKFGLTSKELADLIPQNFTKVLWYLNKVPLIVKYDEKEEKRIRAAIKLLAMETDKKKLVLVGHKLEGTFPKWRVLESLYDLRNTPLYKEIITKFKVSLQERQSIHLEKFINSDTKIAKIIEINDLFLMSEQDLNIGKPLPKLPVAYIPRILEHYYSLQCEDKALIVFNNPVNIVIGKSGIGKSTLMTYLSHQCPLDYWCVRINLIEYSKLFSKELSTEKIMNEFVKDEDMFFDKIKATFQHNKRIYLLLDGLDEIDVSCIENVLTFVKDISSDGIRVWISSRKHLKDKVADYFKISPISIKRVTKENQKIYIEQRLCNESEDVNYTEDETKEIINKLFASVNVTYNAKNILGEPLQLFIITEIFRTDKSNFERIISEDVFVITKMFRIFFQGKEEHQHNKAGVKYKGVLGSRLDHQLKEYEVPALQACASKFFSKLKLDSKDLNESQQFLEDIRNRGDPLGIISQVVGKTNKLLAIFSHHSFAEYFASVWLKKNKEKLELLKYSFFKDKNDELRLMFDIMLSEDKPLHLAVLYEDPDLVEKYINHHGEKDEGGRNALHLISSYSDDDRISHSSLKSFTPRDLTIYQLLLKKCNPFERDELFKWNCLDYALYRNSLILFEVILETKLNEERIDIDGMIKQFGGFDKFIGSCCLYGYFHLLKTLTDRNVAVNLMDIEVKIEVDLFTRKKTTLLHLASATGNRDIIELLLQKGCKINVTDKDNWTPLHTACRYGRYDAVTKILELGGDLNAFTKKKQTPLYLALKNGNTDTIELLLKKGCKVNVADEDNWTPLHFACYHGRYDAVTKILELGGDLNAFTSKKQTPLYLALKDGNTDITELLLKKGCKVNVADKHNCTPLHFACHYGRYEAVTKILELGGDLNAATDEKLTPLHLASKNGNTDIIELLLKKGCKVNVGDEDNITPLHFACCYGKYDATIKILEFKGDINAITNEKRTPLHLASLNDHADIIELLLKEGCDVNPTNEDGWTPLHFASHNGSYDAVTKLLESGGDLNAVTDKTQTPLHLATINGDTDVIELLLKKGCMVNVTDVNNWTPLHFACDNGTYDAVTKILEFGGDVNAITNDKQTALHLASTNTSFGVKDIVKCLLDENKININALDEEGCTPLCCACDEENYDAIEVLLENDAHLDAECRNILSQNFYGILYLGKVRLMEIILQRLTNTEINGALSHFPSKFPIYLATRDGDLQHDLLLKMARIIEECNRKFFLDIDSSEDTKFLIKYLIGKFDVTEGPSQLTLENVDNMDL